MSDPEKKKGCGCIAKGCVVMVVIGALLIGLGVWGFRKGVAAYFRNYTSSEAVEVPSEQVSEDEYQALVKRLDAFKNAAPGSAETLKLNAHDFNLLIAYSPEWEIARGKLHVTTDKDQVGVTGSVPMNFLPALQGQYLNGQIYLVPSMDDKGLHVDLRSMSVRSMNVVKTLNFTKDQAAIFSTYCAAFLTNSALPVLGPVFAKAKALKFEDGVIELTSD